MKSSLNGQTLVGRHLLESLKGKSVGMGAHGRKPVHPFLSLFCVLSICSCCSVVGHRRTWASRLRSVGEAGQESAWGHSEDHEAEEQCKLMNITMRLVHNYCGNKEITITQCALFCFSDSSVFLCPVNGLGRSQGRSHFFLQFEKSALCDVTRQTRGGNVQETIFTDNSQQRRAKCAVLDLQCFEFIHSTKLCWITGWKIKKP